MTAKKRRRPRSGRATRRKKPEPDSAAPAPGKSRRYALGALAAGLAALVAYGTAATLGWLTVPRPGTGRRVEILWPGNHEEGVGTLVAAGLVDRQRLFRALLGVVSPFVSPVPGPHLLADDLTPWELIRRLARSSSRAHAKVVIPEGFNRFQVSARLEESGVCSRRSFDAAVTDPKILGTLGLSGDSAEGYLFPATYDLLADTPGTAVLSELVNETKKRVGALRADHAVDFARLATKYGWTERQVLTLASIVEREAARAEEQPLIASVFFNRLDDPSFRPLKTLQSDPTAGYGCLILPTLASCAGYSGHVTPAMVRDAANPYNTYKHPGLPPGPISNPGLSAIESVLAPATTNYLFFVRSGQGRHAFSQTFEAHETAIGRAR